MKVIESRITFARNQSITSSVVFLCCHVRSGIRWQLSLGDAADERLRRNDRSGLATDRPELYIRKLR